MIMDIRAVIMGMVLLVVSIMLKAIIWCQRRDTIMLGLKKSVTSKSNASATERIAPTCSRSKAKFAPLPSVETCE
jgi:hypothetical protein